ncbi:hypothetical protein D3C79_1019470 [compost metagenome]
MWLSMKNCWVASHWASSPNSSASRKPNLTPPAYSMSALRMLISMLKRRLTSEISGESTVLPVKPSLTSG